jgi:hypothetical protein
LVGTLTGWGDAEDSGLRSAINLGQIASLLGTTIGMTAESEQEVGPVAALGPSAGVRRSMTCSARHALACRGRQR